ncbi:hypothetical protein PHSY_006731 [Pseudozyma hubeiensis SY62]|uniref:Uncharacterized protein n=1 Tax=Pseudozyma hubeiensis (strain SY62) TaxID=1305764 RepID=R9PCK1_PSEHS|nr:hypothetical protein PHSY_006731 [Pseudozyma hubeiensis SY62]GAC99133.1 hypothetical protein PHSY_006731 [Pseudozyma hubeiensis SY62]
MEQSLEKDRRLYADSKARQWRLHCVVAMAYAGSDHHRYADIKAQRWRSALRRCYRVRLAMHTLKPLFTHRKMAQSRLFCSLNVVQIGIKAVSQYFTGSRLQKSVRFTANENSDLTINETPCCTKDLLHSFRASEWRFRSLERCWYHAFSCRTVQDDALSACEQVDADLSAKIALQRDATVQRAITIHDKLLYDIAQSDSEDALLRRR